MFQEILRGRLRWCLGVRVPTIHQVLPELGCGRYLVLVLVGEFPSSVGLLLVVIGKFRRISCLLLSEASSHEAIQRCYTTFKTLLLLVKAQLRVIRVVGGIGLVGVLLLAVVVKATVVLLVVRLIVL